MLPVPARGQRRLAAVPHLDGLLSARVRHGVGAGLADARGTVVLDCPPAGRWSLVLDEGKVTLLRGGVRQPSSVITSDPVTMGAILQGETNGVQAFLEGDLTVRGDLALALQIDGAFDVGERPASFPKARFVEAAGVRTALLEAGPRDAPPVILLHGLGATNASMLPLLIDLARDHRVIAPDSPGFGASAAPHWRYTAAEFANWLDALQERLDAKPATVVGNSLGGRIAIEAALAHPDAVDRLVLLCPSPAFRRLRQFVPLVRLLQPDWGRVPMWQPHRLIVESIRLMFSRPDRLPRQWYDAAADEYRRVMARPAYRYAFFACLRQIYLEEAYGDDGFWDRLPLLTAPTLAVWGERDRLVPSGFARHVTKALPAVKSLVMSDCGHVPQFEFPVETCTLVRDFLAA